MRITVYFKNSDIASMSVPDIVFKLVAMDIPAYICKNKTSLKVNRGKINHGPCKRTDKYYVTWNYTSPIEHVTDFFYKIVDSYHKFIRKFKHE